MLFIAMYGDPPHITSNAPLPSGSLRHLQVWQGGGCRRSPWGRLLPTWSSITPRTPGPHRWSGPGRSTCWFSWLGTGAGGLHGYQSTDPPGPGNHSRRWAPGRSRTCSCEPCPGRALPTAGSSSGKAGCHPETGCAGPSTSEVSCSRESVGWKPQHHVKHNKQFKWFMTCVLHNQGRCLIFCKFRRLSIVTTSLPFEGMVFCHNRYSAAVNFKRLGVCRWHLYLPSWGLHQNCKWRIRTNNLPEEVIRCSGLSSWPQSQRSWKWRSWPLSLWALGNTESNQHIITQGLSWLNT